MSRGFIQSTSLLSGTVLKPQKLDGIGGVDLFICQFEQISAVNDWDEYMSLVQLHHCLIGDTMSCGRYDSMSSTIQDRRAQYGCRVKDASRKLSSIR